MMNHQLNLSTFQIERWMEELKEMNKELLSKNFPLDSSTLIEEYQLSELLRVTLRTMRTYRKLNYFHFIRLQGRIFYLKPLLYMDLLELSLREK